MKGAPVLEKIVIRTDQAERASELVSLLNRIFPECEIHFVDNAERPESQDLADWSQNGFKEEEHGQYFCC
jgi:hypothetical protein